MTHLPLSHLLLPLSSLHTSSVCKQGSLINLASVALSSKYLVLASALTPLKPDPTVARQQASSL